VKVQPRQLLVLGAKRYHGLGQVTNQEAAWCKRPGCLDGLQPSAVGATWRSSERECLNMSEYLQPRNSFPHRSCIVGIISRAERVDHNARPVFVGKKRASGTDMTRRGTGSSTFVRIAEITSGTTFGPAGAHSDLQRLGPIATNEGSLRTKVGRMSPIERRGSGNADLRSDGRYARRGNASTGQRGSRS
jgi:hypothetical protein